MAKGPGQPVVARGPIQPPAPVSGNPRRMTTWMLQVPLCKNPASTKQKNKQKTQISKLGEGYGQHRAREQHFFAYLPPSIPGSQMASCFNRKLFSLFSRGCHYRHVLNTFPKGWSILLYIWLQIEMLVPFFFTQLIFKSLATVTVFSTGES
ncbi:hypothetical protein MC885_008860 [Smutsia gigantea]|nr:hypothetical protein MC885_008860 [Smutsia gigantea]